VKQHYFAAVFLATAAMLAPRLDFRRHALAAARCVALLTALPLASFLATRSFLTPAASGVCHFNSAISELHGPVAGLRLFSYGLLQAFANTFLDESGLESFWLYFTAYRNSPITIMTPAFTALLLVIISALSVLVLMLFLARLTQTARRLALVAEHRSVRSALRVATSNLLINSYIVFFFIIYGFEMMVGGYIPLQGRYWLPFVAGLWIITIESAPRALPKRFRRIFARGLSKALLLTVIVAAACSLPSLYSRFYANSAPLSPPDETAADMRVLRIGDTFRFSGYAVDRRDASPATQTALRLDHKSVLDTRPAASPRLECDTERTLSNAGFEAQLPSSDLTPGRHSVAVLVKVPWSARLLDTGVTARFAVAPGTSSKRSMAGNL
jgi:hypothetical protein